MARRPTAPILVAVVLGALLGASAPAAAAPPGTPQETGCPAGQLLSVVALEAQGPYMAPRRIDTAGNGDGLVCGHPLQTVAAERSVCGGPCLVPVIYLFRDNDLAGYEP